MISTIAEFKSDKTEYQQVCDRNILNLEHIPATAKTVTFFDVNTTAVLGTISQSSRFNDETIVLPSAKELKEEKARIAKEQFEEELEKLYRKANKFRTETERQQ